jgi:hypothetical protein
MMSACWARGLLRPMPDLFVISLLLARLSHAPDWLFGHAISEQDLLLFYGVLDFSF